ncbi:MAG TPA: nodulation protein NodZ [Planctomycetaceae bacterium]
MPIELKTEMGNRIEYLVVKGSGGAGLGDKILALIVAGMYARLTNRLLYIDWKDRTYGDASRNYFHDLFHTVGLPVANSLPTAGRTAPSCWEGRLSLSLDEIVVADGFSWNRAGGRARYSFDQTRLDYEKEILVMWEMDQFPMVRALYEEKFPAPHETTDLQAQAQFFQAHFIVDASIQSRVDAYRAEYFARQRVIGVHVRLTDESEACRRNPTLAAFIRATLRILRKSQADAIFLATDNRTVIDRFRSEFGARRILTIDKWLPQAGVHLHKNPDCPDQLQSARDALIDAYLLGKCDWLVASHQSAFSRLAAICSTAPPERQLLLFPRVPFATRLRSVLRRALSARS